MSGDKAPFVRLVDVVVIGPAMVLGGIQLARRRPPRSPVLGWFLIGAGVATILYNHRNLQANLTAAEVASASKVDAAAVSP